MLYDRIKKLCKEKGITIYRLEKDCGFSMGATSKWDTSSPKAYNIEKVADYFNVSIDYLLDRTNDPTPLITNFNTNETIIFARGGNGPIKIEPPITIIVDGKKKTYDLSYTDTKIVKSLADSLEEKQKQSKNN